MKLGSTHSMLCSHRAHMLLIVLALITAIEGSALGAQLVPVRDSLQRAHAVRAQSSAITSARFSPDGRYVATATLDGTVCVYTVPALARQWCAPHGAEVYSVRWSADGRALASTGGDSRVVQWGVIRGARRNTITLPHRALTLAWTGDSLVVAPTVHGEVVFISSQSGRSRVAWILPKEVLTAAVSPDGQWLVTGVPLERHRLIDGTERRQLPAFGHGGVAFHPTARILGVAEWVAGARLVMMGDTSQAVGLGLPTLQEFAGIAYDSATVNMPSTDIVFTPTGSHVIVAGTDGGVWIWALGRDGRPAPPAPTWRAHRGTVSAVDVSVDGRWLVSAGLDRQLKLWRVPE